jgi:hypothetical protein
LFANQSYRECVDVFCDLLEGKVRDIAFPAIRVTSGSDAESILPPDIRGSMAKQSSRGHPRAKRTSDSNFFYQLSRSEYAKILFSREHRALFFGKSVKKGDFEALKDTWELAFSLGDREAHGDRSAYFREKSSEILGVLIEVPRICEILDQTAVELLTSREFTYDKRPSIVGRFSTPDDCRLESKEITIPAKDGERILRILLAYLSRGRREVLPFEGLFVVSGAHIEWQIAILQTLIKRGWVELDNSFGITITKRGLDEFAKLQRQTQTTLESST